MNESDGPKVPGGSGPEGAGSDQPQQGGGGSGQFIEAHGGTVELESKKGKGTSVTLTIPRGSR